MKEYMEISDLLRECYGEEEKQEEKQEDGVENESVNQDNNWIIRIELNETAMFDMNITNEDIHYTLKSTYGVKYLVSIVIIIQMKK